MEGSGFEAMQRNDLVPGPLLARHVIGESHLLSGCVRDTDVVGYAGKHVPPAECVSVCDVEVLVASALRQSRPRRRAGEQASVGDLVHHVGGLLGAGESQWDVLVLAQGCVHRDGRQ
jgi:hypothetical protein